MGFWPKMNAYNAVILVFVALGANSVAYALACISGALGQASFYTDLNLAPAGTPGYSDTANFISATNGTLCAGGFLGVAINAWSADYFGRKRSLQVAAVVLLLGGALQAGTVNQGMYLAARFITGIGIGALITCIPMYQAELATPESRGFMVSTTGIMLAVGYTLSAWINYGTYFAGVNDPSSSFAWRFPLAFQVTSGLIMLIGSPMLPFSPRWLCQQGRHAEALAVLRRLHRIKGDTRDEYARREFIQMSKQVEYDSQVSKQIGTLAIFRTKSNRKRSAIAFGLMMGAQFTGVFVLATYGVMIYTSLGMTGSKPLLLNACWCTITIPGNIFSALFVDKAGRKTFFIIGLSGILVALICETALQAEFLGTTNVAGQNGAIFFVFFFILFWCTMMDATIYVYLSEIFPSYIRSHGQSLGMMGFFLSAIVVLVAAPIAINDIGWKFFLVLISCTFVYLLCVIFFFPETKQKSLEDLNAAFNDKVVLHLAGATEEELAEYSKEIERELEVEHGGKLEG